MACYCYCYCYCYYYYYIAATTIAAATTTTTTTTTHSPVVCSAGHTVSSYGGRRRAEGVCLPEQAADDPAVHVPPQNVHALACLLSDNMLHT